jgi:4-amino-4-deoxy-L-arabinose transferase-like glycosyltransferase
MHEPRLQEYRSFAFWGILVIPHLILMLLVTPYDDRIIPDAAHYLQRGQKLAEGDLTGILDLHYSPVTTAIVAGCYWLFSDAAVLAYITLQHALTVLAAYMVYQIARRIFHSETVAFVAATVYSLSGMTLAFAHTVLAGFWITFFLVLCFYFLMRAREGSGRRQIYLVASGIFFSLAGLSKISGAGLLLLAPILFLLHYGFSMSSIWKMMVFLVPYSLTFVPIVWINLATSPQTSE